MAQSTESGTHEGEHHRSQWPFVAAVGASGLYVGVALVALAVGTGVAPAFVGLTLAVFGALGLVAGLAGWVTEGFLRRRGGAATRGPTYRTATLLFLGTDVATFAAGFVYYFFVRAGAWPPTELPPLLGSLVLFNTLVLLASSVTLHFAHGVLEAGNRRRFLGLLAVTVALGLVFLGGQAVEYYELLVVDGFGVASVFGSAFYGLTGLHGLHVALGVVFLAVVLGRGVRGDYGADRDVSVSTATLYWHFVDAVWLFLVATLYVGSTL